MRNALAVLVFGLLSVDGFSQSRDEKAIRETVIYFFDALANFDEVGMRSRVTEDFILLEHGERWSIDTLIARVKPMSKHSFKRINVLLFSTVKKTGDIAWTAYDNEARITLDGNERTVRWLESAVLKKEQGKWKLALLHSTRMPAGHTADQRNPDPD
jgi:ketosteroid isomerase-like protein